MVEISVLTTVFFYDNITDIRLLGARMINKKELGERKYNHGKR